MPDSSEKKREKRRKAVALRYNPEADQAPKVTAKGAGLLADRILALAREHNVPIHQDPELVAVLSTLNVNTEIPESLYRAVAEVLAFVFRLNQRMANRSG